MDCGYCLDMEYTFPKNISEHGLDLYQKYMKAKKEWEAYISPIAMRALNEYIVSSKKFYKIHYFFDVDDVTQKINPSRSIKKIYMELSLIFHPDKFQKTDKLFQIITRYYTHNHEMLQQLYVIKTELCECDTLFLEQLCDKITVVGDIYLNKLVDNVKNKKMNLVDAFDSMDGTTECTIVAENFVDTTAYKWYFGQKSACDCVNSSALTIDEIISVIDGSYDIDSIVGYADVYPEQQIIDAVIKKKKDTMTQKMLSKDIYVDDFVSAYKWISAYPQIDDENVINLVDNRFMGTDTKLFLSVNITHKIYSYSNEKIKKYQARWP